MNTINPQAGAAPAGGLSSQLNPSGLGKDEFLELLITQISNQSPLEPMDSQDFVAQLAQFSSVEQLTSINDGLNTLAVGQAGILSGQTVNMLGKTVAYEGDQAHLPAGESAPLKFSLGQNVDTLEVYVSAPGGEPKKVRISDDQVSGFRTAGVHTYEWDGKLEDGSTMPPGTYTFEVRATKEGEPVEGISTWSIGQVSGISYESGAPQLVIGDARVSPADILEFIDR